MLVASAMPSFAHHADAFTYDLMQTVTLKGSVASVKWANPHCYMHLVVDSKGKRTTWVIILESATSMALQGWSSKNLTPGMIVTLHIHPRRDGQPGGTLAEPLSK